MKLRHLVASAVLSTIMAVVPISPSLAGGSDCKANGPGDDTVNCNNNGGGGGHNGGGHNGGGGGGKGRVHDICDNEADGEQLINAQVVVCIGGDVVSIG